MKFQATAENHFILLLISSVIGALLAVVKTERVVTMKTYFSKNKEM